MILVNANRAIETDYDHSAVINAVLLAPQRAADFVRYTRDSIELILARLRKTSPDNIPYWVHRQCAHELFEVVTMAVNGSVGIGVLPSAWRTAIITSVPKCTPVDEVNDRRPISVTPILSRLVERLTVRDHIVSLISSDDVIDQYGFKPTGITTAELVD